MALGGERVWIFDGAPAAPSMPDSFEPFYGTAAKKSALYEPTCVIAADAGLGHALANGYVPDVLIGDLDSVEESLISRWRRSCGPEREPQIIRHEPDKDESDLELALAFALALEPSQVVVLSGGGGRLDHLMISTLALGALCEALGGAPGVARTELLALIGDTQVVPLCAPVSHSFDAPSAEVQLSLIAVGGPAVAQSTGLHWNLTPERALMPASTRGLSNRFASASPATIEVLSGSLLALFTGTKLAGAAPSAPPIATSSPIAS